LQPAAEKVATVISTAYPRRSVEFCAAAQRAKKGAFAIEGWNAVFGRRQRDDPAAHDDARRPSLADAPASRMRRWRTRQFSAVPRLTAFPQVL
jgi:hypothetical protein